MNDCVLEARGVSVQYPGTLALSNVTYSLRRGQIGALIGENGAGKSTLVRVLAGITQPTSGQLVCDGSPLPQSGVEMAARLGIAIIHQELNLCPNLTIEENIFLGRERTRWGLIDHREQRRVTSQLLGRLNLAVDPSLRVGDLPLGQQQLVEIAKALAGNVRVLMMDEPTSALSAHEIVTLFRIVRELAASGVAIVYISHRLEELLEIADTVTVLRDGRLVAEAPASEVDVPWIVEQMTGRSAASSQAAGEVAVTEPILTVDGLTLFHPHGRALLRDVSLQVRSGEIVGLYGLMGAGRTELLESIMGLRAAAQGSIALGGKALDKLDTSERIAAGLAMVPEDRKTAALFPGHSVLSNLTISQVGALARRGWLSPTAEQVPGQQMCERLTVKTPGLNAPIDSLSGGNQQKVVLGRCLMTAPRALLLDEPTRGVDVGAKEELHEKIRQLAKEGAGVLVASSELDEIRALAHRVVVLSRGQVSGEFAHHAASDEALACAASANGAIQEVRT
ncbi:sugar ABC transporter ATP-binding protein [Bryobacterales bacterium F-183]|nr:sugar ABC transporter ATP-binding protein [Bryobacterales bacterium F-183]